MSEGVWPIGRIDLGPTATNGTAPLQGDNFKLASSGTAAGTAGLVIGTAGKGGRVYRVVAQNGAATGYFLQVFNKATAPVNTDVPIFSRRLPSSGELDVDLASVGGIVCPLGIGIAISSTPGVLTLAVATDLAFRAVWYTQKA